MGKNIEISEKIEKYINNFSFKLSPVQKEIIDYNNTLGNEKRMQVAISQCHFLHLIIKISNIKNVLEIGTFTGLSALSIALALPEDGKLTALDKDKETNKIAVSFFKKAKQDKKIQTIVKPALDSLDELKNQKYDMVFIAEPWREIYKNDKQRYESFNELVEISKHIKKTYKGLGYDLFIIPNDSVTKRVDYILNEKELI